MVNRTCRQNLGKNMLGRLKNQKAAIEGVWSETELVMNRGSSQAEPTEGLGGNRCGVWGQEGRRWWAERSRA